MTTSWDFAVFVHGLPLNLDVLVLNPSFFRTMMGLMTVNPMNPTFTPIVDEANPLHPYYNPIVYGKILLSLFH